ncbi:unnamed protein product [Moneuplotes crassus]|uniref:Uncharacterized protein n=1 Tax=Euplotes crassus TaxID=5936 RepID=A0AAD1XYK6_EUPCR|nr:unnamed protein product [Moneuplotes crassus]
MNSPNKLQPKVFPSAVQRKESKSLDDWDISDNVLSEACTRVSKIKSGVQRGSGIRFTGDKNFASHHSPCINEAETRKHLKEEEKSPQFHKSKLKMQSVKSNSNYKSCRKNSKDVSEERPQSLKSEISSLLQKLIKKKTKVGSPLLCNQNSKLTEVKKSTHLKGN